MFDHIYETRGVDAAYQAACDRIREREAELNALWASRFFQLRTLSDGSKKLWPVTERTISNFYDGMDFGEAPEFFYCDETGALHPVTLGAPSRNEPTSEPESTNFVGVVSSACLVANGKVVGHVDYTDH